MFRSIFKKRATCSQEGGHGRAFGAGATVKGRVTQGENETAAEIPVDQTMLAIGRELSGLARLDVGQAAKERGWATLQRELKHRPVRSAVVAPAQSGAKGSRPAVHARGWRWALGSAAAAVAVIAALLGTYGGGLLQTADNGEHPNTVTSVAISETTEPDITVSTDATTITTQLPDTTVSTQLPDTTVTTTSPGTTTPTGGVTPTTTGPVTTQRPVTTLGPTTTQPPASTTTTNEQQLAAAQRDKTAKAVVLDLGALVIEYFATGDMSGARALVAPGAQSSLVQMISSLSDPYGFRWVSTKALSPDSVRMTLEFSDRVSNGQGELEEVAKRFAITVRVDGQSAVVTAISAGL